MKPDARESVSLTQRSRASAWLSESLLGAGEATPYRPGRYLETPQRLGILPTMAFWNRKDVWKSARWLVAPMVGMGTFAIAMIGPQIESFTIAMAGGLGAAVPLLTMGLLERHVRKVLRLRASAETPPDAGPR